MRVQISVNSIKCSKKLDQRPGLSQVAGDRIETSGDMKSLKDLPVELVELVIDLLDAESPSSRSLLQEPSSQINRSAIQPLKFLSVTCRSLRKLTLPILFKHMVLNIHVQYDKLINPYRRTDITDAVDFIARARLQTRIKTVVVEFILLTSNGRTDLNEGFASNVCSQIMDLLEPQALTIVMPPSLTPYLAMDGYLGPDQDDGWAFDIPIQVLTCRRTSSNPALQNGQIISRQQECWEGPWSSVTINEASSVSVYSSYEYYLKRTPSFFRSRHTQRLLRWDWSKTLRHFEYIAIFPTAPHICEVFKVLRNLHCLEVLSVQFGPHESSDIMSNQVRLGKCQISDLWMEFGECYVEAFRFASEMRVAHELRTFEILDWPEYKHQIYHNNGNTQLEEYMQGWHLDGENGIWTFPNDT